MEISAMHRSLLKVEGIIITFISYCEFWRPSLERIYLSCISLCWLPLVVVLASLGQALWILALLVIHVLAKVVQLGLVETGW